MSAPTLEERQQARAIYLRLLARSPTTTPDIDPDVCFCIDVALRLADHVAETFGLPRFHGTRWRVGETAVQWIDRLAADIARWRGERVEQRQERRGRRRHVQRA